VDLKTSEHLSVSWLLPKTSVVWNYGSGFGREVFHLYGGECPRNDKGSRYVDGVCNTDDMDQYRHSPGQDSLVVPNDVRFVLCGAL
jgi:hypothetical protein